MASRGVLFALDENWLRKLKSFRSDASRLEFFEEELERDFFISQRDWLEETDKSWDAMHRALTDGELAWDNGTYPLNHVILGGEPLYEGDDYILVLKTPDQVRDIAAVIPEISKEKLRSGYDLISSENCDWDPSEHDFEYTWEYFAPLRAFFQRAAQANRSVVFSASQ